jgi:ATP-binding cassette subfamily C (CFTR/MRP) protein 1
MILDDVLAGLDRATERHILNAVFAPDGLLKNLNSTIILATSSGSTLHATPIYASAYSNRKPFGIL